MWDVSDDPSDFTEAVRWFRSLVPMTDGEFALLTAKAQARAFMVSQVAELDIVQQVYDAIDKALSEGTDFRDFAEDVGDELTAAWGGEMPYRLETIFRTNVQTAYAAGRYEIQADPDVRRDRPFKRFSSILDGRTSEVCGEAHGTVLAADDPWWDDHEPPLHFNCRSTAITLTDEEARAEGLTEEPTPTPPSTGFGAPPTLDGWNPDFDEYDEPLRIAAGIK